MRPNAPLDLWDRVAVGDPDECWPWQGGTRPNGYGIISIGGRNRSTHRLAYELATGSEPGSLLVCHHCDNRICCNPRHLYLGTGADNARDIGARGRRRDARGSRHPQAKLTEAMVREIRRRRSAGERGVDLAAEFGVVPSTITRLVRHADRDWSHV